MTLLHTALAKLWEWDENMEGCESHALESFASKRSREMRWWLEQSGEGVCVCFLNFLIIFFFLNRNTDVFVGLWEQSGREGAV